jgi:peroxiredoxin
VSRRLKATAQLLALGCLAGLLALLVWSVVHQQRAPRVGAVAPAFTLRRLEGPGRISLAAYRGKPVVLNFWASWCEPCKSEAAVLERDWTSYRERGVVFLGVDYHDLASDARRFVRAHALTFTMLEDGSGKVTSSYGINQVPETYVLNRQGRVVAHLAGPITDPGFAGKFRSALAKAASGAGQAGAARPETGMPSASPGAAA